VEKRTAVTLGNSHNVIDKVAGGSTKARARCTVLQSVEIVLEAFVRFVTVRRQVFAFRIW